LDTATTTIACGSGKGSPIMGSSPLSPQPVEMPPAGGTEGGGVKNGLETMPVPVGPGIGAVVQGDL